MIKTLTEAQLTHQDQRRQALFKHEKRRTPVRTFNDRTDNETEVMHMRKEALSGTRRRQEKQETQDMTELTFGDVKGLA